MSLRERIEKAIQAARNKDDGKKSAFTPPLFRWFRLVEIPQSTPGNPLDLSTFNDEVAELILRNLTGADELSFLEIYVTNGTMDKLVREYRIDRNYESLLDTIRQRILDDVNGNAGDKIAWDEKGLIITPALQQVFDPYFIVRPISPPQHYAPVDESRIPTNVDQILIGALKIEDGQSHPLGETPIRALLQEERGLGRLQRVQVHTDFDLILKAFPDEAFRSYPLSLNITCGLQHDGNLRKVALVQLDLHDTKLLAQKAGQNQNIDLSFTLIEGGVKRTNVNDYPDETKPVEPPDFIKGKRTIESYEIGPDLSVPVNRKIGIEVMLRYRDDNRVKTQIYRYLFRFFKYALRYVPGTNRMAMRGQFVKKSGETLVMLPPIAKGNVIENQAPVLILTPQPGEPATYLLRKHKRSSVTLTLNGNEITETDVPIDITGGAEILGDIGQQGDSQHESFKFTIFPTEFLNDQRKQMALKKGNSPAFVEIQSDRTISLSRNEVVLGRGRLLHRDASVSVDALKLKHRYVTWEVSARKDDQVFYYCEVQSRVTQPLAQLTRGFALGLVSTYYLYLDDFEFVILLESTPSTEIALISFKEEAEEKE